jgi:hypothetical protein
MEENYKKKNLAVKRYSEDPISKSPMFQKPVKLLVNPSPKSNSIRRLKLENSFNKSGTSNSSRILNKNPKKSN